MKKFTMVAADEVKPIAYGEVKVLSVHGFNNQAEARFLQLHEGIVAPAASAVPVFKSLWFPAEAGATYGASVFGTTGISFKELIAAISTTETNYTEATNTGLDLTIIVEGHHLFGSGTTVVGDVTTGVDDREIWAHSDTNTKRLLRLDFFNDSGITQHPIIFARSADANGLGKYLGPVVDQETISFFFGPGGGQIEEDLTGSSRRKGCYVSYASGGTFPWNLSASTDCAIRGVYE